MKKLVAIAALVAAPFACWSSDAGVSAGEIRIGTSAVLSGPLGSQTREYVIGSQLYFDVVNAQGGVHGRKIAYKPLDDGFDVKRAVENTRKLIEEDKVFVVYNNTGTAQVGAILPLAESSRTIVFGPVTGATSMRAQYNRHLFHVRASYAHEARRIVSQLKNVGITRVVAFYQDDPLGKTLLQEVRKAAADEQVKLAAEVKVDPKQPDFAAAAKEAAAAEPQAVIMGTAGTTFPSFVKAMNQGASRPNYYGFSIASVDLLNKELGAGARGIVLAQIMPSLKNNAVPVVREYLKVLGDKMPEARPTPSQLEGWVHANLLVEGLRRAGRNLSTESFIQAMETSGEIAFGNFKAQYTPQSHNGSSFVELAIIDGSGQLRY
ncbi:ABC transporter substrate-binding protein [Ramlibacter pallidus]|uniref:ABC transporter substrate-binding protein n=1 Tax=Ramlibacter pallidus TaxID=2780087 RepID=A0ABR9S047_9BURK|nr:ABC transporter substrate-binding protein [Ramlibacter pallidus]MBE7366454.1 ABC transporter substrate-binding protein [Ramlibacter pallidus]